MQRLSSSQLAATVLMALWLGGCGAMTGVESNDPEAIPSGPLEAQGAAATGPVVALGGGRSFGVGWRYAMYPSEEGWCTQLEMAEMTSAGCGDPLPAEGRAFGSIGYGTGDGGAAGPIEGIVSPDVSSVWVVTESDNRFPVQMMSLEPTGLDGSAFVAIVPAGETATQVLALARSGDVLETFQLESP